MHDALKSLPSFKDIPEYLLQFIPQMTFHLLNVQPLANETILSLRVEGLLRSLLLSMVVAEDKNRIQGVLIEIFKFMSTQLHLSNYFSPIFHFLIQEGYFTKDELQEIKDYYFLTPNQDKDMMTTVQAWKQEGSQEGELKGELKTKRLSVLRGHFRKYKTSILADISNLPLQDVQLLLTGFDTVKKVWKKQNVNVTELTATTTLSEEEIDFIVECLESTLPKA